MLQLPLPQHTPRKTQARAIASLSHLHQWPAPARATSAHVAPKEGGKAARAGPQGAPGALPATRHCPPGRLSMGGTRFLRARGQPCEGPREDRRPLPAPVRPPPVLPAGPAHTSCCQEGGGAMSPLPPQPHRRGKGLGKLLTQQASEPFLSAKRPSAPCPGRVTGEPWSVPASARQQCPRPPSSPLARHPPRRCTLCGRPANTCLPHFPSVF